MHVGVQKLGGGYAYTCEGVQVKYVHRRHGDVEVIAKAGRSEQTLDLGVEDLAALHELLLPASVDADLSLRQGVRLRRHDEADRIGVQLVTLTPQAVVWMPRAIAARLRAQVADEIGYVPPPVPVVSLATSMMRERLVAA